MKKICSWSGPRNVSTAFMYSFAQREDTIVVDEPLYGHYLRISGAKHPGHHEIMQKVMNFMIFSKISTLCALDPPKPSIFLVLWSDFCPRRDFR